MNFEDEDNAGLLPCIEKMKLPDAFEKHCDRVSLADFIVIAGEAAMGRTASTHNPEDYYAEGTLAKTFRDHF